MGEIEKLTQRIEILEERNRNLETVIRKIAKEETEELSEKVFKEIHDLIVNI